MVLSLLQQPFQVAALHVLADDVGLARLLADTLAAPEKIDAAE